MATQKKVGSYAARQSEPVLLIEQFALADWVRDGEPVAIMAARLMRSIPQTRKILFG